MSERHRIETWRNRLGRATHSSTGAVFCYLVAIFGLGAEKNDSLQIRRQYFVTGGNLKMPMANETEQLPTSLEGLRRFVDRTKRFDFRRSVVIAAAVYALVGAAVTLLGWALGIPRLTDWVDTGISMFANPAVCAGMCGVALILLCRNGAIRQWRDGVRILALLVAVIGGLTLFEHFSGLNLGIDTLLFNRSWGQRGAAAPMRMGLPASTSFMILGVGLYLATCGQRARWMASNLAILSVGIASLSLIGFWYGSDQLYTIVHLTAIAPQMSTILAMLGIGLMAAIPGHGIVLLLCRDDAGGMLIRTLFFPIVVIPLLLGWLRRLGQEAGLYDTGFGLSILMLTIIGMLLALLALTASRISREAQALKDSRAQLEAVLKQAPVAIGVVNANGCMTMTNDLMRRYAPEIIPSHDRERIDRWRVQGEPVAPKDWPSAVALRGEPAPVREFVYKLDDGQNIGVRSSATSLRNEVGKVVGAITIMEDITELKQLENELRQRLEELAEADRLKSEFLATLAHELRNPLAPIRNSLHILQMTVIEDPATRGLHEIMQRQVNHIVRLVDDLLDLSRITTGKIDLRTEVVEIDAVLHSALETSKPLIDAGGHHLSVVLPPEPLTVDADPVRLSQVVANLLNNAAKYTEPGGQIGLSVAHENGEISISVRDTGIGIASAMLPQVFRMFAQADKDHKRAQGGLGIGLALSKSLIEMHGGRIDVRSEEGVGSEFTIRLPLTHQRSPIADNSPSDCFDQLSTRSRILVVDDNLDAAYSLAILLRLRGNEVETANDGIAALEAIASFKPTVVFLDLGMPGMSGFEVAQNARAKPGGKECVLVAVTGWGQDDDRRRTREAGFNHHLVKPVEFAVLELLLAEIETQNHTASE